MKRKHETSRTPVRTPVYQIPTPAETGQSMLTQMTFAIDYLKNKKGDPQPLDAIIGYLSLKDEDRIRELVRGMRAHRGIAYTPPDAADPSVAAGVEDWRLGTYAHLAKLPGVRDKVSLLTYLQRRTDSIGVSVKDIKDGWPDCDKTVAELEREHKILVIRTKKDNHARLVWQDVESLHPPGGVEPDVLAQWHKIKLPRADEMPRELAKEGQKPSSHEPKVVKAVVGKQPKKKAARKTAKFTNTHLATVLQDYSAFGRRAV